MKSEVFFIDSRARIQKSPGQRFRKLLERAGLDSFTGKSIVALKIHFGEEGATGYLHPVYPRTLVEMLKKRDCKPYLTDTNTLYHGPRSNGVDHYELAVRNGFGFEVVGAPLVIADGIRSRSTIDVPTSLKHFSSVKIALGIWEADGLITLNHFKGHLLTSFGGAIKNLSMGCASRATKQRMHADVKPELKKLDACTGCGVCVCNCPVEAITLQKKKAVFNRMRCTGCAECITCCPYGAIRIQWSGSSRSVQEKMAEVALAVVKHFNPRCLHVNFLLNITPECDCMSWTDNPIVQNIGVLASTDPVALDQASLDLVTRAHGLSDSALPEGAAEGQDKFGQIHPEVDPEAQLEYGEKIGLGSRSYALIEVE